MTLHTRHFLAATTRSMVLAAFGAAISLLTSTPSAKAQMPGQDPREEIKEIFKQVEKDLQEIDKLLLEAARDPKGSATGESAKAAAKNAHDKQKGVSDSIQKIIELIPPSGSSSQQGSNHGLSKPDGSQGRGQGQPPQGQPGDKPQDGSQGSKKEEQTAQGAGQAPTEPQGVKPNGGKPEGNQKSNEPPQQAKSKPRDYETERANRSKETVERWGDLPEHSRKVFENSSTDDLPLRYRKWIQDFYSRVQKTSNAK